MSYLSLIHDNYYCQKYLFNETTLRKIHSTESVQYFGEYFPDLEE